MADTQNQNCVSSNRQLWLMAMAIIPIWLYVIPLGRLKISCRCCRVASVSCVLKNGIQSNQIGAPVHYVWTHQRKFSNTHMMLYACIMYLVIPYMFTIQVLKAVCWPFYTLRMFKMMITSYLFSTCFSLDNDVTTL